MPLIELPNNQSAIIYAKDEITERINRAISRAFQRTLGASAKLIEAGLDEKDPSTWHLWDDVTDEQLDQIDNYQLEVIKGMVKSSTLDLSDNDKILDLPKATFDALVKACLEAYGQSDDFSPDAKVTDPKAPDADSTD